MRNLRSAKARVGKYPEANCWGMTAFLLGWRSRLYFMSPELMVNRLSKRLRKIKKPKRFRIGDVASKWYWTYGSEQADLMHTAVSIGRGEWLHQRGYRGEVRTDTFDQMIRSYAGRARYYRA